jgi:phage baseplate assembly protein W
MARNTRTFSDLDLNFTKHPVTKDIVRKYDEEAIKAAVKNLVLTQNYERPFHSEIGSQLRGLLFEPASPMLGTLIQRAIRDTIIAFEPRVNLLEVNIQLLPDSNEIQATIVFMIINTTRPVTVDLILTRTR